MSEYWLVTGANRGIGLALVTQLATRPNTILFATVRDTSKLGADLSSLIARHPNIHPIQLRLELIADAKRAATEIATHTDHLDVVIANAGIAYNWESLESVDPEVVREHFTVNTLGTLALFQAVLPLLRKSKNPKFIPITTQVATITEPVPYPVSAVALSKIGVNFITQRIHVEHGKKDGIIAFPVNPGGVKTDLGAVAAPTAFGIEEFSLEPEDSAAGVISVIEKATSDAGGRFWSYDGAEIAW
jgi:NAD(P)-dependent dehydrogenase (short-subunit alcohol dehydrogenase family)